MTRAEIARVKADGRYDLLVITVAKLETGGAGDTARARYRQGAVTVVGGVPLPNPESTGNLLVGTIIGRWLASHADVLGGTLLDLGCGNRPYEPWYESLVDTVIAMDPAPGATPNVIAMADAVPLRDNCVDVVLCTEVFEHVDRIEHAVAEMVRVMKPGASTLVTVPFLYPTHEAPYDFHRLTHIGLRSIVERHGLEVQDMGAQGGPLTVATSWTFRALRAAIDTVGRRLGSSSPLSLRVPFRWLTITPQQLSLALRSGVHSRLTRASRLASTGYMVLARKPF
jgi:hypothetical protein